MPSVKKKCAENVPVRAAPFSVTLIFCYQKVMMVTERNAVKVLLDFYHTGKPVATSTRAGKYGNKEMSRVQ